MMKTFLTLSVILLFIGVAVAPSINISVVKASQDDDLVEVTTQACGIKGFGNTTVKLTKQQAGEVEHLFDTIKSRLDNTTSREETINIFNETIVELDKYGLLGDLSVEKAQRLVTGRYQNLQKLPDIFSSTFLVTLDDNENRNCLITGKTTETWFESPMTILCYTIIFNYINNPNLAMPLLFVYILLSEFSTYYNPFAVFFRINFGGVQYEHEMEPVDYYASGWVYTRGSNGIKTWEGDMQGTLPLEGLDMPSTVGPMYYEHYPGTVGFTGIKINSPGGTASYLGSALWVKISELY